MSTLVLDLIFSDRFCSALVWSTLSRIGLVGLLRLAWSVLMINSSAQRAKWTDQTAPSSEQTANWSIDKASSKVKTVFSSCRSAWSRSRRRRGRRPHEVFGFASNVLIIDGELRKTFGQCSTLKRASRSLAKTGSKADRHRLQRSRCWLVIALVANDRSAASIRWGRPGQLGHTF